MFPLVLLCYCFNFYSLFTSFLILDAPFSSNIVPVACCLYWIAYIHAVLVDHCLYVFRCILSFEVLYSVKSSLGPFKRVNEVDIIFTSFHHLLGQGKLCKFLSNIRKRDYALSAATFHSLYHLCVLLAWTCKYEKMPGSLSQFPPYHWTSKP